MQAARVNRPYAAEEPEGFQAVDTKATSTTGVIRGVVIDETISPVPGARVVLVSQDSETITDADGIFIFSDLEPGPYFLKVSKLGFAGLQASTTVTAGVYKPPIVRVMLTSDPESLPYLDEFVWSGFFTCSTAAFQVCPAVDEFVLCTAGSCDTLKDEFMYQVEIESPPTWINTELVWEATQVLAKELDFYLEKANKETGGWSHKRSVEGPSPLLITVDEDEAAGMGFGVENDMQHRIFPRIAPESALFINQKMAVYTHEFYNYSPYEGWRFTDDDAPSPPR